MKRSRKRATEQATTDQIAATAGQSATLYMRPDRSSITSLLDLRQQIEAASTREPEAREVDSDERWWAGYSVQRGVAVLPVLGPLLSRAPRYWRVANYQHLQRTLALINEDDAINATLMDFSTFGGMCEMCGETARLIREASAVKPIWSIAHDYAASAGYWLASAANRLIVTDAAEIGSIGVVVTHFSYEQLLEDAGIEVTHIHAGALKVEMSPWEKLTEGAIEREQQRVNVLYEQFVDGVASFRPMTAQQVRDTEAGMFSAADAVELGLADEVGAFDDVLSYMGSASPADLNPSALRGISMTTLKRTAAQLRDEQPEAVAEIEKAAKAEGEKAGRAAAEQDAKSAADTAVSEAVAANNARVQGILTHAEADGRQALATKLAFTGTMSVDDAAEIMATAAKDAPAAGEDDKSKNAKAFRDRLDGTNPDIKPDAESDSGDGEGKKSSRDRWAGVNERASKGRTSRHIKAVGGSRQ